VAHTGSRTDTNFTTYENEVLSAFTLLDFSYSFPIYKNIGGSFVATNICNIDFVETIGYQTLGRNLRFGMNWRF
jgi:vitamin B12 transporter